MLEAIETTWKPGQGTTSRFVFLCAAGLFVAGLFNLVGGKISLVRLGLTGLAFIVCCGLSWLAWQTHKKGFKPAWNLNLSDSKTQFSLFSLTILLFMAGWFILWTPLDAFGKFYYYLQGAYPFVVWMTCVAAAAAFLLAAARYGLNRQRWLENLRSQRGIYFFSAAALGIFSLLAVAAAFRVAGMQPEEESFWYGAGVPVVTFQVFTALILGIGLTFLINKLLSRVSIKAVSLEFLLFLLIWGVSAWLWAREPVKPEFLVTQPVAPNYEIYPDYDARLYDVMSQFALIGQGINNHSFFDRVLYPAFLTYLHSLAGQDYSQVTALQAGIFAIIPALMYLIGNSLYNRAGGLSLAILTALRGVNAINIGNIINTSHQKQMLTEFPTALLLVLATLLLIKWLQNPSKNWTLAGLAGAVIGLSTLVRPHTLMIIPVFLILVFFAYRQKNRIRLGISALFLTAALCSVMPWVQFGGQNVSIFSLYFTRIQSVIQERYPSLKIWGQTSIPGPIQNRDYSIPTKSRDYSIRQPGNLHLADYSPQIPTNSRDYSIPTNSRDYSIPTSSQDYSKKTPKSIWAFAADNFLNNLVTSVQILPNTPFNLDAHTVVKKTDNYWKPFWDGSLTGWAKICILLNLCLLALGLGTAWGRARWAGLLPLLILVAYYLADSFGRTSGGRYIVPADWVVPLYYVLGLFAVLEIVKNLFIKPTDTSETQKSTPFEITPSQANTGIISAQANTGIIPSQATTRIIPWWLGALSVLVVSFSLGAIIPLAQAINPLRYPLSTPNQQAEVFISIAGSKLNLTSSLLNDFLLTNNAVILSGRSLYPRQMAKDEGLDISVYNYYHPLPYPRTLFTTIGHSGENVIILPRMEAAKIPDAADVMVVGCKADGYILAWAVIRTDDKSVFERTPGGVPLACPLPEPVCDTNKSCRSQ